MTSSLKAQALNHIETALRKRLTIVMIPLVSLLSLPLVKLYLFNREFSWHLISSAVLFMFITLMLRQQFFKLLMNSLLKAEIDQRTANHWIQTGHKNALEEKEGRQGFAKFLKQEGFTISAIGVKEDHLCAFLVICETPSMRKLYKGSAQRLANRARPEITINGKLVSVDTVDGTEFICYGQDVLKADSENIVFGCGGESHLYKNPYYMSLSTNQIKWQCEGHAIERKILIDCSGAPDIGVPYPNESCLYSFDLLIQGKYRGTFNGKYSKESDIITVDIRTVDKKECIGRECHLRLTFDKRYEVLMPPPIVMTVDHKPVRNLEIV